MTNADSEVVTVNMIEDYGYDSETKTQSAH